MLKLVSIAGRLAKALTTPKGNVGAHTAELMIELARIVKERGLDSTEVFTATPRNTHMPAVVQLFIALGNIADNDDNGYTDLFSAVTRIYEIRKDTHDRIDL